jgi:hypothetical protein
VIDAIVIDIEGTTSPTNSVREGLPTVDLVSNTFCYVLISSWCAYW